MNILTYCNETIRGFGFKSLVHDLTFKFLERTVSYARIQGMTLTLSSIDPSFLDPDNSYEYRFLNEAELREYAKDPGNDFDADFLENALAREHMCYAIIDGGKLAGYGWYSKSDTHLNDELVLCFNQPWVYMFKGYTNPSYRGQRLHAVGMGKAMEAFSRQGSSGLISCVHTNNFRSLRSVQRLGYRNFGKVTALKVFGKYWIKADEACRQYGFTLKPARGY